MLQTMQHQLLRCGKYEEIFLPSERIENSVSEKSGSRVTKKIFLIHTILINLSYLI